MGEGITVEIFSCVCVRFDLVVIAHVLSVWNTGVGW